MAARQASSLSPWANPCHTWLKGVCQQGLSCRFQHTGIPLEEWRCFVCNSPDHIARGCACPGGGADPGKKEKQRLSAALELAEEPAVAEAISDRTEELSRSRSMRDLTESLETAKEALKKEEFTLEGAKKWQDKGKLASTKRYSSPQPKRI